VRLIVRFAALLVAPAVGGPGLGTALKGAHRSPKNMARDEYRHPRATLEFFGLREGMTVVELAPAGAGTRRSWRRC
jgi:predicted methyltransferase